MAQRVTAAHAIFDTFNFQRGCKPTFDSDSSLSEFLQHGDGVLDRDRGFFFGPVSGRFVVAFESPKDHPDARAGEHYFDVFWLKFEDVEDIYISDMVEQLQDRRAPSFVNEIDDTFTFTVPSYRDHAPPNEETRTTASPQEDSPSESTENDESEFVDAEEFSVEQSQNSNNNSGIEGGESTTDSPEGVLPDQNASNYEDPTAEFIAQYWEQQRRSGYQLKCKVVDLDRFNYLVDGVTRELSFVSAERVGNKTFDIVGGEFEYELDTAKLKPRIKSLREDPPINIASLPTYQQELNQRYKSSYTRIQDGDFLDSHIQHIVGDIESRLESAVNAVQDESAATFVSAYNNDWEDTDEEESLLGGMKNVVSKSQQNQSEHDFVKGASTKTLTDEEVEKVVDAIVRAEIEASIEDRREKLLQHFEDQLEELTEELRERMTKEVLKSVDDLRTSTAYKRTNSDST